MAHDNTYKRKEIKYLLTAKQYESVILAATYFIKPDVYHKSTVNNIYCDSQSSELARRSIEKPEYKEKLRLRAYGETTDESTVYIELKKKYQGVVYKRRYECTQTEAVNYLQNGIRPSAQNQVFNEIDYTVRHYGLSPAMFIAYNRLAFCGADDEEFRVTFDFNITARQAPLTLKNAPNGMPLLNAGSVLMEIKAAQAMPQWMLKILNDNNLYPTSFSKYGCAYRLKCAATA